MSYLIQEHLAYFFAQKKGRSQVVGWQNSTLCASLGAVLCRILPSVLPSVLPSTLSNENFHLSAWQRLRKSAEIGYWQKPGK